MRQTTCLVVNLIKTYNFAALFNCTTDPITKTFLYNFDPLKPYFHIAKLGFTGVYIIFLFLPKIIDCGTSKVDLVFSMLHTKIQP